MNNKDADALGDHLCIFRVRNASPSDSVRDKQGVAQAPGLETNSDLRSEWTSPSGDGCPGSSVHIQLTKWVVAFFSLELA